MHMDFTGASPESGCSPAQRKYCELKSNKTCTILDGHPECSECLPDYVAVAGECLCKYPSLHDVTC